MPTAADFSWKLPSSPDSKDYKEILAFIEELKKKDVLYFQVKGGIP